MSFKIQPTPVARLNRCQLFGPGSRPEIFEKMDEGDIQRFPAPLGLSANAVLLLKMKKRPSVEIAQKCGANIAKEAGKSNIHLFVTANARAAHLSFGIALRRYNFNEYKTHNQTDYGSLHVYITNISKILIQINNKIG